MSPVHAHVPRYADLMLGSNLEAIDIKTRDDLSLRAFSAGERGGRAVLLINAYGMPVEFMRPLSVELVARGVRVLTWESRGVPNMEAGFTPDNCRLINHVHDAADVLDAFGVQQASVVGWCSGAQVALGFASHYGRRVRDLVLVNGGYTLWSSGVFSEFQARMNDLMPICARGPESAELICKIVMAQLSGQAGGSEVEAQVGSVVGMVPPEVLPLTAGVFSSPERLYRYANLEARFLEEPDGGGTSGVVAPTLVLVGDSDIMSSPANSRQIARQLSRATLEVVPQGNHYMHYLRSDVRARIADYVAAPQTDASLPLSPS